jgi:hypothetical protein
MASRVDNGGEIRLATDQTDKGHSIIKGDAALDTVLIKVALAKNVVILGGIFLGIVSWIW